MAGRQTACRRPEARAAAFEDVEQVIDAEGQPARPENALKASSERGLTRAGTAVQDDRLDTHTLDAICQDVDGCLVNDRL